MLNNDLSANMKEALDTLLQKVDKASSVSNITFLFTSPNYPDRKVFLSREIKKLTIEQDFVQNFTDKITAELTLTRDPYLSLVNMRKNLYCRIQIFYVDPGSPEPEAPTPDFEFLYKCTITNFEDIYKKIPKEKISPTERTPDSKDHLELNMTVEMIADDVYKARKQQLHLVARNTTMNSILHYAVNYFGFSKALIVAPDNKRRYTNFVIPPAYGVENIMSFLQTAPGLGVYNNGFNSYISNGCWYIYPRYGKPVPRCQIHVYSVGLNMYAGLSRYDYEEETVGATPEDITTHILCNTDLRERNWSDVGSENEPTAASVLISEAVFDGTRKLLEDNKIDVVDRSSYFVNVPSDPMDKEKYIKVKFLKSNGNLHTIRSSLRVSQGTGMNFTWVHARPWVFRPATIVQIHYDGPNGYETVEGMCESATYTFVQDPNYPLAPRFTCSGEISVNCNNVKKD